VLAHARALLGSDDGVTVLAADAREPKTITEAPHVWQRLDRTQPVAVLCLGVLDALTDDEAADTVRTLREACASGSYLALTQLACECSDPGASDAALIYRRDVGPIVARSRHQVETLFEGYDLLRPGIVPAAAWGRQRNPRADRLPIIAGVGQLRVDGVSRPGVATPRARP